VTGGGLLLALLVAASMAHLTMLAARVLGRRIPADPPRPARTQRGRELWRDARPPVEPVNLDKLS
jgi:hypothetical protein